MYFFWINSLHCLGLLIIVLSTVYLQIKHYSIKNSFEKTKRRSMEKYFVPYKIYISLFRKPERLMKKCPISLTYEKVEKNTLYGPEDKRARCGRVTVVGESRSIPNMARHCLTQLDAYLLTDVRIYILPALFDPSRQRKNIFSSE